MSLAKSLEADQAFEFTALSMSLKYLKNILSFIAYLMPGVFPPLSYYTSGIINLWPDVVFET